MLVKENKPVNRLLIAKHGIVAAMKLEIWSFYDIMGLFLFVKKCEENKEMVKPN